MKIAVASGKGGTGKTFFATNLFYALQQQGYAPTLVDCDAEEPNAALFLKGTLQHVSDVSLRVPVIDTDKCTYCNKCHDVCSYHAIFILPSLKVIRVLDEFCHGCGACTYVCEAGAIREKDLSQGKVQYYLLDKKARLIITEMHPGVYSPVKVIQSGIREANDDDLVILDAPPGTSCPFIHTIVHADYVVLVTEPTPFGLSDLKHSIQVLRKMKKSFGVVINRAGLGDRSVYDYLLEEQIPLLMEIPFSLSIAASYARGDLVSKYDKEWRGRLNQLYHSIITTNHGNSHHQR